MRTVPVRIDRVRLQRVRIKQRGMGAVDGNAHFARRLSTTIPNLKFETGSATLTSCITLSYARKRSLSELFTTHSAR